MSVLLILLVAAFLYAAAQGFHGPKAGSNRDIINRKTGKK